MLRPAPDQPGRHCGCTGCPTNGDHKPMPRHGTVRVWQIAAWLNLESSTIQLLLKDNGVATRSPSSLVNLSEPDFAFFLAQTVLRGYQPLVGLPHIEFHTDPHLPYNTSFNGAWAKHLVSSFWLFRSLARMRVSA